MLDRTFFILSGSRRRSQRLLLGLLFSSGIALVAYRRQSLDKSGALGALASGTGVFGLGGWSWGLSLIYFFVSSSLLSHFRARDKASAAADKFSKGSRRDISQVAANGGLATLFALLYGLTRSPATRRLAKAAFTGALATANADTWATELGVLSTAPPRLITTGKPVATGTSGGITLLGTVASSMGACTLGIFFRAWQGAHKSLAPLPLIALISGMAGSFFDSLLGATIQAMYYCPVCKVETERRVHRCGTRTQPLRGISWMNNDVVNFMATACGSAVASGMAPFFLPLED
ncbi:MAG TPA: DUF92 domain-containing protein [Ktedonobacteraceae bacterium]|nr:DUF92 domain-containing protein [Ktedonobacteraceae bacterium]